MTAGRGDPPRTSVAALLRGLSTIAGQRFPTASDATDATLALIADRLGMRTAYVARIDKERDDLEVVASFNVPGGCEVAVGTRLELPDAFRSAVTETIATEPLIAGRSISVPIMLADGSFYGVLAARDPDPRDFGAEEVEWLTVVAHLHAARAARDQEVERRRAAEREAVRIQSESERSRGQMRALLDAASDGMVLVDPGLRFRVINRRFVEMFGLDAPTVLGHTFDELADEAERIFDDAAGFAQAITGTVIDQERVISIPVTQRAPVKRELQMLSTPVHGAGKEHLGRLYAFRDVTNEREVDRLKTEFVSLVSHELRTPLTSIKGFVDLLFELEVERLSADQIEFLTIVRNNVDRLVAIINDLLDISRIESGHLMLDWSEFDLKQTIAEVAQSFQPQLATKRQRLTVDVATSLPFILGDRARVLQILTNLVSNAHKYTPEGGEIAISARAEERFLAIDVADTGVGMTAEEIDQLFTKFFRARNRATQQAGGTGLGLTITRSLVEALGGQIDVTSQPGEGTTFHFTLLIAAGERRAEPIAMPWSQGEDDFDEGGDEFLGETPVYARGSAGERDRSDG